MGRFVDVIKKYVFFKELPSSEDFILKEPAYEYSQVDDSSCKISENQPTPKPKEIKINISKKISENIDYMKKVYNMPLNSDIVLKEIEITFKGKAYKAFIIFFDSFTNSTFINQNLLTPLMLLSSIDIKSHINTVSEFVEKRLISYNQVEKTNNFPDAINMINFGGCAVFIDTIAEAFLCDVKGWEHRTVGRPNTEMVIRGPQEGFVEVLRINTALLRKILMDEDLIIENVYVGERSRTPCAICYINSLANDRLVEEVRRRVSSVKIDYLFDSGELEQLIEDNTYLPNPTILSSERPDRTAFFLSQGRVVILVHGSPFALIIPIVHNDLIETAEDFHIRFPYVNLLKFIRFLSLFLALLLPGLYIAITNYHQEMIPTDLLLSIEVSREKVPFPTILEILIMEISFELIREAGIRIPAPIGPTLGIIGALILGEAAVSASIVSPILIIIVAVTGIGSFAVPNFSLAFGFRILRFMYIILGAIAGFFGITFGLFVHGIVFAAEKSFGVPFIAPFAPKTSHAFFKNFIRMPIWKQDKRPDFINPKDIRRQPKISRLWKKR